MRTRNFSFLLGSKRSLFVKSVNVHVAMEFEVGKGFDLEIVDMHLRVGMVSDYGKLEAESFNVWFHENYDAYRVRVE